MSYIWYQTHSVIYIIGWGETPVRIFLCKMSDDIVAWIQRQAPDIKLPLILPHLTDIIHLISDSFCALQHWAGRYSHVEWTCIYWTVDRCAPISLATNESVMTLRALTLIVTHYRVLIPSPLYVRVQFSPCPLNPLCSNKGESDITSDIGTCVVANIHCTGSVIVGGFTS